ncbi:MAG: bifunctional riboflavin kinase/FMN adenylyltransferase [Lachnospiraceae bacterium]|nr:bifunctional riboflavin kinase/FMN adenylyltransferase [Lachnospiraceae bacterium]
MELITQTTDFYLNTETAVAIGKFDGVHIGHRRLLDELAEQQRKGLKTCVFTFDPSPAVFFARQKGLPPQKEVTTAEEKRALFERMGIDFLVEFPMNEETAATEPETFVREILGGRLGAVCIAAGEDLSFGAGGRGDLALLEKVAGELGIEVRKVEKVLTLAEGREQEVSSTLIRRLLDPEALPTEEGAASEEAAAPVAGPASGEGTEESYKERFQAACELLGGGYPVIGTVVHGRRLGRQLGFPTINLEAPEEKLLPRNGVYLSEALVRGRTYRGISNVGVKPTVDRDLPRPGIETYLFDFDEEIYGEEVELQLRSFVRPEHRFDTVEDLKAQLQRDIAFAKTFTMP